MQWQKERMRFLGDGIETALANALLVSAPSLWLQKDMPGDA
jgi:hypothetical protein